MSGSPMWAPEGIANMIERVATPSKPGEGSSVVASPGPDAGQSPERGTSMGQPGRKPDGSKGRKSARGWTASGDSGSKREGGAQRSARDKKATKGSRPQRRSKTSRVEDGAAAALNEQLGARGGALQIMCRTTWGVGTQASSQASRQPASGPSDWLSEPPNEQEDERSDTGTRLSNSSGGSPARLRFADDLTRQAPHMRNAIVEARGVAAAARVHPGPPEPSMIRRFEGHTYSAEHYVTAALPLGGGEGGSMGAETDGTSSCVAVLSLRPRSTSEAVEASAVEKVWPDPPRGGDPRGDGVLQS